MPKVPKIKYSVRRKKGVTVVEAVGKASLLECPGVVCVNPKAPPAKRVYRREFRNPKKRIYLAHEYDLAVRTELAGRHRFVIAMNGYSTLTNDQCAAWGVKPGAYEKACGVLLAQIDRHIHRHFPDACTYYVHGASDMGVDKVISETATRLRRQQLGFSCPEYLFYVPDNEVPVYVAETIEKYSDAFVRSSDILIAANGREQSFRMDIASVFTHDKFILPVNVLKLISTTGGPPAKGANGKIEDAVAHFQQRYYDIGVQIYGLEGRDIWAAAVGRIQNNVSHICRQVLGPEIGLEIHGLHEAA